MWYGRPVKTYQVLTHPESLNRGLEVHDDARGSAPVMVDTASMLLTPEEMEGKKAEFAACILEGFHGRAFLAELLAHLLFREKLWRDGEKVTEREVIQALGIPASV